jgi:hypothetical protein
MQQQNKILVFLILNEAQHVSGDTAPIITSLKLSGSVCYLTTSNNCASDNLSQYYAKPEAACAVLGF